MNGVTTTRRVRIRGPLEEHVDGFGDELERLGFAATSVGSQLRLMAHLSRWLDANGWDLRDLTVERIETFISQRRASYTGLFSRRALRPLLDWLSASGLAIAGMAVPPPPTDPGVLVRYEEYLLVERGLQPGTAAAHVARVRRFLNGYISSGGLEALRAGDVTRALLDEGEGRAPVSVKKFGYVLKAFLRFCLLTGEIDRDLTGATLVIRSPQPSLLPVGVGEDQIQALLGVCDRATVAGRRDYAVIMLLAHPDR